MVTKLRSEANERRFAGDAVMVTFAARHGDPYPRGVTGEFVREAHSDPSTWGPTLRAIGSPESSLFGKISDLYYLCHSSVQGGVRKVGVSDCEVAGATEAAVAEHIDGRARPRFHIEQLPANGPPNDHAELFDLVKGVLRRVRSLHPSAEIVLQLSSGTSAMHAVLLLAGSVGIVEGPIRLVQAERSDGGSNRPGRPIAEVRLPVTTILQLARASAPLAKGGDEALSISFDRAKSPALRHALSEAQRAAPLPFPVLLRGERGVGKSTIAQVIRAASPYRKASQDSCWPSVACGQFTDAERLNSELCGSVKGAYTGAENRWGLLKAADGDTLFLDEIQDLDVRSQRVLIRVVEDGIYYRLGEDKPHRSNFRLICGTNQSDSVLLDRLAADFYDRIRDIEIEIPPLRDCREDLRWMWEETWRRVARQCALAPTSIEEATPRIVECLASHPLPGNWRDLRRLAVRIAVFAADGKEISPAKIERIVRDFGSSEQLPCTSPAQFELGPRLGSKRDQNHLRRLEATLGTGLIELWNACGTGKSPRLVLADLLGDRHRAQRAAEFVARIYPDRWQQLSKRRS